MRCHFVQLGNQRMVKSGNRDSPWRSEDVPRRLLAVYEKYGEVVPIKLKYSMIDSFLIVLLSSSQQFLEDQMVRQYTGND